MPATICKTDKPLYLNIFPSWKGRQPVGFFMMENLLEARLTSAFPTNGAGPDEDVNVFLAGLLTDFLTGEHNPHLVAGSLLPPPDRGLPRRYRARYYLVNANHRLLHLGLLNRGDGLRRRLIPFGFSAAETRQQDLESGAACYRLAANLLRGRKLVSGGLVEVLDKLADNFEDYVQVLAVLATRRLGLGARLSDADLNGLLESTDESVAAEHPPCQLPAGRQEMNRLLDLILQYRAEPGAELEMKLRAAAKRAGADSDAILRGLRRT